MLKVSVVKFLYVKKQRKVSKVFPSLMLLATSWNYLCNQSGHVTKIKTSLNINLRMKEQNNRLPGHVFLCR